MGQQNWMDQPDWFEEKHAHMALGLQLKERLFSKQSEFQKVEVVETHGYGKLLAHDGMVMVTERDEFIYHDMIVHVPMHTHPHPQKILVIGGGDGGTVREVLKHPSVQEVTMVEIDPLVIEASQKFLPQTSKAMEDPKVRLKIQDGVKFVKEASESFDLIIVDSSEPMGPATPLFNLDFYGDVVKRLNPQGVVISQGESPYYDLKGQKSLLKILAQVFPKVHLYNYCNMTYPMGLWSFTWASKGLCPFKDFDPQRVSQTFKYYNQDVHYGAFMLPEFMKVEHKEWLSPLPFPSLPLVNEREGG